MCKEAYKLQEETLQAKEVAMKYAGKNFNRRSSSSGLVRITVVREIHEKSGEKNGNWGTSP